MTLFDERCSSQNAISFPAIESYTTAIAALLLSLVTIPGNFFVCLAVLKATNKNIRNPFNFFVLSLAVADLVVGCVTEPLAVYVHVKEARGARVENVELEFLHMSYFISCTTSVLSICLLGIERYIAIMSPLKFRLFFTIPRFVFLASVVWLISIALSSIYLMTTYTTYALVFSTNAVGWTLGVSIFTYTKILRKFNERLRNAAINPRLGTSQLSNDVAKSSSVHWRSPSMKPLSSSVPKTKPRGTPSRSTQQRNGQENTNSENQSTRSNVLNAKSPSPPNIWNVKLTKTYLVIISIFLACYFPACVAIYTMKLCASCSCTTLRYLQDVQFIIIAIQSALNPFVYAFRFKQFRDAVMEILHCRPQSNSNRRSTAYFKSDTTLTRKSITSLRSSVDASTKNVSDEL